MNIWDADWSKPLVDPDILRKKTEQILHHTDRLNARKSITPRDLIENKDLANIVLMDLQQAIQGCIDLAIHACVDEELGAPSTAAQAFLMLADHGRVDFDLANKLTRAAGLRNLIVHQYTDMDYALVLEVVSKSLNDLRRLPLALKGD
ncbi:MAG: DUF86 domain-containing protein [Granulosicoccus sp.]